MNKIIIFITILMIISLHDSSAQSIDQGEKVLLLHKKSNNKYRYFKEGKRLKIWLKQSPDVKIKGRIETINDSTIVFKGRALRPDEIYKIRGHSTAAIVSKIVGGAVMVLGGVTTTGGILMIVDAKNSNDCGAPIVYAFGVVFTAIGTTGMLVGGIPFLIGGKKYMLNTGEWQATIANKIPKKK